MVHTAGPRVHRGRAATGSVDRTGPIDRTAISDGPAGRSARPSCNRCPSAAPPRARTAGSWPLPASRVVSQAQETAAPRQRDRDRSPITNHNTATMQSTRPDAERIAIIGAGASGLALGWLLSKGGKEVTIFEAAPRIGGLARSFDWHGIPCDIAPHRLHTDDQEVPDAVKRLRLTPPGLESRRTAKQGRIQKQPGHRRG